MPEGEGYAAPPPDEREFPDLPPIRPNQGRTRGAGGQDEWRGQHAQPGQYGPPGQGQQPGQGGYGGGYPNGGQSGPGQANPGYAGQGQAPWPDQERPDQERPDQDWQARAPAGQPAGRPGPAPVQPPLTLQTQSQPGLSQQAQPQWTGAQQGRHEEDVPSWAEPDSVEAFSARWHRRGLDSRDERRSDRRKRRRTLFAIGGGLAVVIAVAVYFLLGRTSNSTNLGFGSLVTTFLPGEVQSVPNACDTVSNATLSEYLPGTLKQAAPPLNSGTNTECSWTLDNSPTYRVLETQIVAYTPSALVANANGSGLVPAGNGSATYAAEAAFASFEYGLTTPAPKSLQPKAALVGLSGMPGGVDTSAFAATQVFNRNGTITDVATVYVRYRNVIVTASMEGIDQSNGPKKYGPVSMSDLTAAAKAVAREVAAKIV